MRAKIALLNYDAYMKRKNKTIWSTKNAATVKALLAHTAFKTATILILLT